MTIKDSLIYGRRPSSAADCSEDNNRPPMAQMSARTYQAPPPTYKDGRVGYVTFHVRVALVLSLFWGEGGFPIKRVQKFTSYQRKHRFDD